MSHEQDPKQRRFAESLEQVSLDSLNLPAEARDVLMYQCGLAAAESERNTPACLKVELPTKLSTLRSPWLLRVATAAMVLVAFGVGNFLGRTADSVQYVDRSVPPSDSQNSEDAKNESRPIPPDASDENLSGLFRLASGPDAKPRGSILAMTDWNSVETFLSREPRLESSSSSDHFVDDSQPLSVWLTESQRADLCLF